MPEKPPMIWAATSRSGFDDSKAPVHAAGVEPTYTPTQGQPGFRNWAQESVIFGAVRFVTL